jgi:hypothetical protein
MPFNIEARSAKLRTGRQATSVRADGPSTLRHRTVPKIIGKHITVPYLRYRTYITTVTVAFPTRKILSISRTEFLMHLGSSVGAITRDGQGR